MTVMEKPALSSNAAAAISYVTFFPAVAFLLLPSYKENQCLRFHAWQSILFCMFAFATNIVLGAIALLSTLVGTATLAYTMQLVFLFWVVLWIACVIRAMQGKRLKLPIIGGLAEKLSLK